MATEQRAKKLKSNQDEEKTLHCVLALRSQAPQQYFINLTKENVKYCKRLNDIETVPVEPFAPNFMYEPHEIVLSDDMFQKRVSKASEIKRKAENIAKCLAMRREYN